MFLAKLTAVITTESIMAELNSDPGKKRAPLYGRAVISAPIGLVIFISTISIHAAEPKPVVSNSALLVDSVAVYQPAHTAAAGRNGMVSSGHHLASKIGAAILSDGGNAIDAAVAVGYAMAVTVPGAGNIGGGGFMTVRMANGVETMIDFREAAPARATPTMYLDSEGKVVGDAGARSWNGVAVPGTVAGLEFARNKFGTLPHKTLVIPAVRLANDGFRLTQWDDIVEHSAELAALAKSDAYIRRFFMKNGEPYKAGEIFKQPNLAKTLQTIANDGAQSFYQGWIPAETVRASSAAGGILTQSDFEKYQALEYDPVRCTYRGYNVISAAPPSSGGVSICQTLNIMEGFPLSEKGYQSPENLHHLIEAFRYVFHDRNMEIGDPRFVTNDVSRLTDKRYAAEIRSKISSSRAGSSDDLKKVPVAKESRFTTHYSVVDKWGNAVSVTYSLGLRFGTGKVAGEAGYFLNDTMIGFTAKVGAPNAFGLVQGPANSIAPEKRSLSSMSPTIITKNNKVAMVVGGAGGPRIISGVAQVIMNALDYQLDVKQAVDAPRIHHQWLPDVTFLDYQAIPVATKEKLKTMGHAFKGGETATSNGPLSYMNSSFINAILVNPESGLMTGSHDSREPTGSGAGIP